MTVFQGAYRVADSTAEAARASDDKKAVDYASMTNSQLAKELEARGIEAPKKASKAKLLALLSE